MTECVVSFKRQFIIILFETQYDDFELCKLLQVGPSQGLESKALFFRICMCRALHLGDALSKNLHSPVNAAEFQKRILILKRRYKERFCKKKRTRVLYSINSAKPLQYISLYKKKKKTSSSLCIRVGYATYSRGSFSYSAPYLILK